MNESTHIEAYTLERYVARDLDASATQRVETHLQPCERCSNALEQLRADVAVFKTEVPYAAFRIEHEARMGSKTSESTLAAIKSWWMRPGWLAATASAGALAAVLLVTVPESEIADTHQHSALTDTRIKGSGASLTFAVQSGGRLRPGVPGEALAGGTALQLSYDAQEMTHMALIGVDSAGTVSVYFPDTADASHLAPVPDGAAGTLPFSLTLDDSVGGERFFALFADAATPLNDLLAAARTVANQSQNDVNMLRQHDRLAVPPSMTQASTWIEKR